MRKLFANRKLFSIMMAVVILLTSAINLVISDFNKGTRMVNASSDIEREYSELIENLDNLPINFIYRRRRYFLEILGW